MFATAPLGILTHDPSHLDSDNRRAIKRRIVSSHSHSAASLLGTGSILLRTTARRPASLSCSAEALLRGWANTDNIRAALRGNPDDAGWVLYSIGDPISISAYGLSRRKSLKKALLEAVRRVTNRQCNCIEIALLECKTFLGFWHIRLTVASRHLQLVSGCPEMSAPLVA